MTELCERLVALTRDLISIRSTADRPGERRRAVQFFLNRLQGLSGICLNCYESDGFESLLALPDGVLHPEVLLCGHLDVVAHSDEEAYASVVRDGRIWGAGAGDMKGALAILLDLFLKMHHRSPGVSLGLAITSDEEIGGMHGLRYLVEECGLRAGIGIIPDGGSLNEVTVAEKGILHRRVVCRGQAAHAARPWLVDNPIHRLVGRLDALVRRFELFKSGVEVGGDHWYPTCAVSQLRTPNFSVNQIPSFAEAALDIRFPPPHSVVSMERLTDGLLEPDGGLCVETVLGAEPTHLDPDPLFLELTEEVSGCPAVLVKVSGGSDARFLCAHGIPVLLSRPRVGNLHAADEWIDIGSMEDYFAICERYIERRQAGLREGG